MMNRLVATSRDHQEKDDEELVAEEVRDDLLAGDGSRSCYAAGTAFSDSM